MSSSPPPSALRVVLTVVWVLTARAVSGLGSLLRGVASLPRNLTSRLRVKTDASTPSMVPLPRRAAATPGPARSLRTRVPWHPRRPEPPGRLARGARGPRPRRRRPPRGTPATPAPPRTRGVPRGLCPLRCAVSGGTGAAIALEQPRGGERPRHVRRAHLLRRQLRAPPPRGIEQVSDRHRTGIGRASAGASRKFPYTPAHASPRAPHRSRKSTRPPRAPRRPPPGGSRARDRGRARAEPRRHGMQERAAAARGQRRGDGPWPCRANSRRRGACPT